MAFCCRVGAPDIFLVMFWREAPTSHLELFHRNFLGLLRHTDIFLARKKDVDKGPNGIRPRKYSPGYLRQGLIS